eukprot:TRINITY_DN92328_c0_g1_i1.p1 TRINITY_DN92328_c0_g1~~TRINITY_DN92328_c0_g1_i1.p1  ORF type:complete len:296 (-),score=76.32 TRINITY_DN92328_c0_g1_i1:55-942(-)
MAGAQIVAILAAIFVVPKLMSIMPNFDPLLMIMGLFGILALVQQLQMSSMESGGQGEDKATRRASGEARESSSRAQRSPEELLEEAERCLQQNSWDKVQALAKQVTDADPEHARAWELQATALKWDGKREEALNVVERARDLYEVKSSKLDELFKELSSVESPVDMATECETKGDEFISKRQYDLAADIVQKALDALESAESTSEVSAQRLRLQRRKAECAQQLQDWGACRRAATAVLEVHPDDTQALLQRAVSNEAMEKFSAALEDARKLLTLDPKSRSVANRIVHNCQQALKS